MQNYFNITEFLGSYQLYSYEDGVSLFTRYNQKAEGPDKLVQALDIFENFKKLKTQYMLFHDKFRQLNVY